MQLKCLDSLPLHLPRSYHDVGEFACGQVGRALVSAVTTLEYFGYACMQLILLWHQLEVSSAPLLLRRIVTDLCQMSRCISCNPASLLRAWRPHVCTMSLGQ